MTGILKNPFKLYTVFVEHFLSSIQHHAKFQSSRSNRSKDNAWLVKKQNDAAVDNQNILRSTIF